MYTVHERGVMITIAGINLEKFSVAYCFSFSLTELNRQNLGSHEIMLGFKLENFLQK